MSCDYLKRGLTQLNEVVDEVAAAMRDRPKPAFIACCGTSGLLVAPVMSVNLRVPLVVVRKGEHSHSKYAVENHVPLIGDFAIIDDMISSGRTIFKIITELQKKQDNLGPWPVCKWVYLWNSKKMDENEPCNAYKPAFEGIEVVCVDATYGKTNNGL